MRVWDLAAGGAALLVLEGHTEEVATLRQPSRARRSGRDAASPEAESGDRTVRVWDASKGGAALRVVPFEDEVKALTVWARHERGSSWLGKRWGELRIETASDATDACVLSRRDVAAIRALLQEGAGVDQQDDDGYTPLFGSEFERARQTPRACCLMRVPRSIKQREGDWSAVWDCVCPWARQRVCWPVTKC